MGMKFLQTIPKELKCGQDLIKFKKQLKEFLIGKAIYSLDEFFHLFSN